MYQFTWDRHAGPCGEHYSIVLRENGEARLQKYPAGSKRAAFVNDRLPLRVTSCRDNYIDLMSGVPKKADGLLHAQVVSCGP